MESNLELNGKALAPQYAQGGMQPLDFIRANNLNFSEACVVKYVDRWPFKNGAQDLYKSVHYSLLLLQEYFGLDNNTISTMMKMIADYNNPHLPATKQVLRAPQFHYNPASK